MIAAMSDEDKPKSFEETLRAIADEVTRGIERVQRGELEDIAREYGVDADRAKRFMDDAGDWLRAQADGFNHADAGAAALAAASRARPTRRGRRSRPAPARTRWTCPTEDQGRALAALDSGRWTVEPGTSALSSSGDGPGPSDALGLVRELRVRDWIDADGEVTLDGPRRAAALAGRPPRATRPEPQRPVATRPRRAALSCGLRFGLPCRAACPRRGRGRPRSCRAACPRPGRGRPRSCRAACPRPGRGRPRSCRAGLSALPWGLSALPCGLSALPCGLSALRLRLAVPVLRAQLGAEHDLAAARRRRPSTSRRCFALKVFERAVELPTPLRLVSQRLVLEAGDVRPARRAPSLQTPSCSL